MGIADTKRIAEQHMEQRVTLLLQERRLDAACALVIEVLGPQVRGYLRGRLGNDADGDDLYGALCEVLVTRLADFQGRCSVKTWLYAVARHLACKRRERYSQRRGNRVAMDDAPDLLATGLSTLLSRAEQRQTLAWVAAQLSAEERELLILRAEREFSFPQIAQILATSEANARQRFQRLKVRLKALAAQTPHVSLGG